MAHAVGRLIMADAVKEALQSRLLERYGPNEQFRKELAALGHRYRRLLRVLVLSKRGKSFGADDIARPQHAYGGLRRLARREFMSFTSSGRARQSKPCFLPRFLADMETLTGRWGLKCAWAGPRLYAFLAEEFKLAEFGARFPPLDKRLLTGMVSSHFASVPPGTISIQVEFDSNETWKAFVSRVLDVVRPEWETIRKEYAQLPDWELRDTRPELSRHTGWLYLRICPQPDGQPLGWVSIGDTAGVSWLAVRNAVLPLAHELDIALPILKPGRQRRSTVPM